MNIVTVAVIIVAALLAGLTRLLLSNAPQVPEWVSFAVAFGVGALVIAAGPAVLGA